jgi:hypothetical protein
MLQQKHSGDAVERRKILFIGCESPVSQDIRQFVPTLGCICIVVSSIDALTRIKQESFDAVLLDLVHSEAPPEQIVLAVKNVQPTLLDRILLITGAGPADGLLDLPNISHEKPLTHLWAKLEEIFLAHQVPNPVPPGMHIPALIFDSHNSPIVAGVRGSTGFGRQLAYRHNSTTINLLSRLMEGVYRISLLGQVLDVSMRAVHDLPVLLRYHDRILAQTVTTQFGEFGLQFDFVKYTGLQIQLAEGSWIYMPLENMDRSRNPTLDLDAGV